MSLEVSTPNPRGFFPSLREALSGSARDYTEGSIGRAITLLAIPMVLEMMMESLFGIVDVFFVAKLGQDAVATVGLTESMLTLLFAVALGLSMATTAVVARRIGEKNPEQAAVAAVQSIAIGLAVSLLVGLLGVVYGASLLQLMGAPPSVIATGHTFTRIVLGSSGTIFLLFLMNAIFRGSGDPAVAMRALWLANAINIVLNPCLIFGLGPFPAMGLAGSAVGTTIGRGVGVLFQFWMLSQGRGRIVIGRNQIRLDVPVMVRLLRLSLGGMFQYFIPMGSWIGLVRIISTFGAPAIAGYTLGLRVIVFAILPSWGMSNAAATLVGQNLGAGKPERAERSAWMAGLYNMIFLGSVSIVFMCFAEQIIGIFTQDQAVAVIASSCLRLVSSANIFYAFGMVMVQSFNGAGDTVTPTILNVFCYWLFQIPLAYVLAFHAHLGPRSVFLAIPIAESVLAVASVLAFRRGKWKLQKV